MNPALFLHAQTQEKTSKHRVIPNKIIKEIKVPLKGVASLI